ncbi:MAG: N-acetylmuramoyl-L-alanine amidase, partial [Coprothermobacterota bacterium]|nr:N-acetylmuramoyl-L-alanine amidase [Coprothermobacterota bacterium]
PGHGKDGDPGAVGASGVKEADVNLALACFLENELRLQDCHVWLPDRQLLSSQRAEEATRRGCDLLVSLHCNAAGSDAKGIETWFPHGNEEGEKLANSLQQALVENAQANDRGVKDDYDWRPAIDPSWTGGMGILRNFPGPVCLVELLFISNPEEEKKLNDRRFILSCAQAICQGILSFLGRGQEQVLFPDLSPDLWQGEARAMVLQLAGLGIVKGRQDGAFGPQEPLTRLEGAALLHRSLVLLGKIPEVAKQ